MDRERRCGVEYCRILMIYLGADHGGFKLKEKIKEWLAEWKLSFKDLGPAKFDPDDDYPQYAFAVADAVSQEDDLSTNWSKRPKGILVCRSAGGVVIAANKVKDVRAVAIYDVKSARHAREHNDANVIGLSADWIDEKATKEILQIFLKTEFSGEERHRRRINQIREKEYGCGYC